MKKKLLVLLLVVSAAAVVHSESKHYRINLTLVSDNLYEDTSPTPDVLIRTKDCSAKLNKTTVLLVYDFKGSQYNRFYFGSNLDSCEVVSVEVRR